MSETERITNEVCDRHNLMYHLEHDREHDECCRCEDCIQALRQFQRQWYRDADGIIRQGYTFGTILEPKRNVSRKRWPAWLRETLAWCMAIAIIAALAAIGALAVSWML